MSTSPSEDPARALDELPHGAEFRFLDEITALDGGKSGVGRYRFTGKEAFVPGHFPGDPIMPGVILVEAIAQLGGVVAQSDPDRPRLEQLRLSAIRSAKFPGAVRPGATLEVCVEIEGRLESLVQVSGSVRSGAEVVASARVVLGGKGD